MAKNKGYFYPPNPALGQQIQTAVEGLNIDASYLAHISVAAADAVAADDDGIHAAITLGAVPQVIVASITNPKYPRNITITGNAVGNAGNVKITGTNIADEVIEETLALNGSTAVVGAKAFKTVAKIELPIQTHVDTDTVKVGFGDKLGIPFMLTHNTVLAAYLDNAKEGTAATVAVSATALESNTVDLNSALNGKVVDIYLIV
jgi:hypothetical protein